MQTVGGSGGASSCVVNSTVDTSSSLGSCSVSASSTGTVTAPIPSGGTSSLGPYTLVNDGWPKPAWQTNAKIPGLPADSVRDLPDVSFFASDGYLSSSAYLMCASATNANNAPCAYSTYSEPFYQEVGGTSVATPAMAGVMALINQKAGMPQGSPNSSLYALAAEQSYSNCSATSVATSSQCFFNDIESGANAMPCDFYYGTPNCTTTQSTFGSLDEIAILPGYSAVQGYDQATGLGSLNVANVVNSWISTIGSGATTITVTPTPATVSLSQSVSVQVTVASNPAGNTTPTGTVVLSGGGYTSLPESLASTTNISGAASMATFSIPAGSLAGGSDTLTVSYGGNSNYAPSTGSASVMVSKLTASVSAAPAPSSIQSNQPMVVTGSVACSGACTGGPATPSGTVTVSYGSTYTSSPVTLNSGGSYSVTITPNSFTGFTGTENLTLMVQYSGDANYNPANASTSVSVTYVPVMTPTIIVTTAPLATQTVDSGTPVLVTVTVSGPVATPPNPTPTGSVTLAGGGYTLTLQTLQSGIAQFNIPANMLKSSPNSPTSDTLTADYLGDPNYAQVVKPVTLTVVQSTFSLAASTPTSVSPGAQTTSTITVSSPSDYTGTVTFTSANCVLTGFPAGVTASTPGNPTCALTGSGTVTFTNGSPAGAGTVSYTVSTSGSSATASLTGPEAAPALRNNGSGWFASAGGSALAALFLFLVPAGSRRWRKSLGLLMLVAAFAFAAIGCGGGGGGGNTVTTLPTPTVTLTPSASSVVINQPLSVKVTVSGSAGTPTGGVSLSGGGDNSIPSQTLSSGSATFNITGISPNAFINTGSVTLTANYQGDSNYNPASGSSSVTVTPIPTTVGAYTFTVTPTGSPAVTPAPSISFTVMVN